MNEGRLSAETLLETLDIVEYDKEVERLRQEQQTPSVYGEPQWWEDYPGITQEEAEAHAKRMEVPTDISAGALQQAVQSGDQKLSAAILAARQERREQVAARLEQIGRESMADPAVTSLSMREAREEAREKLIYGVMNMAPAPIVAMPSGASMIRSLCAQVHQANQKWWVSLRTGRKIVRNVGEMLMLVTSELAEAMEGHRKDKMDDHLPHRKMIEVELADALIRILDMSAGMGLDLGGAFEEKMAYNATRKDHQREARLKKNGKKY